MSKKTLPRQKDTQTAVAVLDQPEPDEVNELDAVNTAHIEQFAKLATGADGYHNLGDAILNRAALDNETLGQVIEHAFTLSLLTLKMCQPLVSEMKKRFKKLSRKKQKDGSYQTICGYRTFQDWCKNALHRSEQAVYLMLRQKDVKPKEVALLPEAELPKMVEKVGEKMPPEPQSLDQAVSAAVSYTVMVTKELDTAFRVKAYRKVRVALGKQIALEV